MPSISRVRHRLCATGCLKEETNLINSQKGCQEESVPSMMLALVSMILEGPSIKDNMIDTPSAALEIAQMLKLNSVKHGRVSLCDTTATPANVRHSVETPVPGMMLHAHTRKNELDRLSNLGLSILYDHVLRLSG